MCNNALQTTLGIQMMLINAEDRQFLHCVNVACNSKCERIYVFSEILGFHGGEYEDFFRDVALYCLLSKTSVNFYQTKRRYIPQGSHIQFIC
jgi:hypothetical protein